MSSESFTFACPMNSASAFGRSESSTTDSSLRTSGVVISARDIRANLALLQHGERRADHVAGRSSRAGVLERAPHGLLRVVRGIAERDQGAHGNGGSALLLRWRARGRFGADEILHLVAELHAKPFGDLLADARHALQRAEVAIADRAHHAPASERGDQAEREGGSHAARGEERVKERAAFRAAESEQLPAVFLHDQRRVQRDLLADARQRLEHAQRNEQFVSHAAGGHDLDAIDALRDERPLEARDHPAIRRWSFAVPADITQVSAHATPSAASAGCGALLRCSRRATMNCTCSFVAAPRPTTVFLMSAGAYSWMVTPARAPASSTTPRACPSTTAVRTLRA